MNRTFWILLAVLLILLTVTVTALSLGHRDAAEEQREERMLEPIHHMDLYFYNRQHLNYIPIVPKNQEQ